MRVVAISDTHMLHKTLVIPEGDVLVHAGDMTNRGTLDEVERVGAWFNKLPHQHIVVIAGNHDWAFQREPDKARLALGPVTYLQDSGCEIGGFKFWGSPWQPWFMNWAFNLRRGHQLREKWAEIPHDTDVLITHGPPRGVGDLVAGESVGCSDLLDAVARLSIRAHIFGHIHEGYGIHTPGVTKFVNAAVCDEFYRPNQAPLVFDL